MLNAQDLAWHLKPLIRRVRQRRIPTCKSLLIGTTNKSSVQALLPLEDRGRACPETMQVSVPSQIGPAAAWLAHKEEGLRRRWPFPGEPLAEHRQPGRESVCCPEQQGRLPCISTVSANSKQGQLRMEETKEMLWSPESQTASPSCTLWMCWAPVPTESLPLPGKNS